MPDQIGSQYPPGNADRQPPPPPPFEPTIEQRIVALESKSHTHTAQEDSTKEMKREFRVVEIVTIATNVILAVVGIFALRAYYGQLSVMQGQLDQMQRSGEQSTEQGWSAILNINWLARSMDWSQKVSKKAMESSEQQSQKALQASIDQFRRDQRAWVGVTDVSIKDPVLAGHKFVWIGYVANSGKTPSLETKILAYYKTGFGKTPPEFTYPPLDEPQGVMVIQPGSKFSLNGHERADDPVLTEEQVQALKDGVTRMYIYGTIEYRDVSTSNVHTTHWCVWMGSDLANTHPCDTYNDAN